MKKENILRASGLFKRYMGRQIIDNVSFELRMGQIVGLLGPNGAGKTTCFYMLMGMVLPDEGKIEMGGADVTAYPMYHLARLGLSYLPQESSVFRNLSVQDNIKAVLQLLDIDKKEQQQKLETLLKKFEIDHLRQAPSLALSGGERRRLEIARCLASDPKFILLDEPFAGVDPVAISDIRKLILALKQQGLGILITDHNVKETLGLIDYGYIIHSGKLLEEGNAQRIISNPEVKKYYLGQDFSI